MPVTINVEDYEALFEHTKRPHIVDDRIGNFSIEMDEVPIWDVELQTQSDGRFYGLAAQILYNGIEGSVLGFIEQALAGTYRLTQSYSDSFIVADPKVYDLSVEERVLRSIFGSFGDLQVEQLAGAVRITGGAGIMPITDLRRIKTLEDFVQEFEFFRDVTERTINAIYSNFGSGEVPDHTINVAVSAPKEDVETELAEEDRQKAEEFKQKMLSFLPDRSSRFETLSVEKPELDFDQIIGNEEAKEELRDVAYGVKNPDSYARQGTKLPTGILLHGPPGTGKTTLARATAFNAEAAFYAPNLSEILSKWYGEAEQRVQELFDKARETSPSIIFLDEIDAIGSRRDSRHEASQMLLSAILTNMQGIKENEGVIVIGATNRHYALDEALIRPGRFDRWVYVGLPNTEELAQIFVVHQTLAENRARNQLFVPDIDYTEIAKQLPEASGADASEIIRRVLQQQVREERRGKKVGPVGYDQISRLVQLYERRPIEEEQKRPLGFQPPGQQ